MYLEVDEDHRGSAFAYASAIKNIALSGIPLIVRVPSLSTLQPSDIFAPIIGGPHAGSIIQSSPSRSEGCGVLQRCGVNVARFRSRYCLAVSFSGLYVIAAKGITWAFECPNLCHCAESRRRICSCTTWQCAYTRSASAQFDFTLQLDALYCKVLLCAPLQAYLPETLSNSFLGIFTHLSGVVHGEQ